MFDDLAQIGVYSVTTGSGYFYYPTMAQLEWRASDYEPNNFKCGFWFEWLLTCNGWTVLTRYRPFHPRVRFITDVARVPDRPCQLASTYG